MKRLHAVLLPIVLGVAALGGCASAAPSQPVIVQNHPAIPLVDYSDEFQAQAAREIQALPRACSNDEAGECSALRRLADDYGRTRAIIRSMD